MGLGDMYKFHHFRVTTGVTKKAVSQTKKIFIQCNSYQCIALEVGFHLMYLTLVGGVIRRNHDL